MTGITPRPELPLVTLSITYLTTDLASSRPSLVPLTRSHVAVLAVACPQLLLTVGDVHHFHATGGGRRVTINQVQGPAVAAYQKYDFFVRLTFSL